jgi:hypothetical protein
MTRTRDAGVETMTGALRYVDGPRWEAVYRRDGELYLSSTCATRALAEAHLVQHRDALEAAGWTRQPIARP